MTTITFSKDNKTIRVEANDHAYGSDVVCNGISALIYSLESWLINHPNSVKCHESEFKTGKVKIEFVPIDPKVFIILGFVYGGLLQIEYSYGRKYICVNAPDEVKDLMG